MKAHLAAVSLALSMTAALAAPDKTRPGLTPKQKVIHLYDRLAFGPMPGDVEKLVAGGEAALQRWIEEQLDPASVADTLVETKLRPLKALAMDSTQLAAQFPALREVAMAMGIDKERFQAEEGLKKKVRKQIGKDRVPEEMYRQLVTQKLIRAVESRRQLETILVDFWFNHFNVDFSKNETRWLLIPYERDTIKKNVFGNFVDLLKATAHHPAMLFYLDNHLSVAASAGEIRNGKHRGLNENYARELLELHTLGVDGGYTQKDVTELARILTGWSISGLHGGDKKKAPEFKFKVMLHDDGPKTLLGNAFEAGRLKSEGDRALELLATHPSTAKFIAMKLCRHFVADQPPEALVEKVARRFTDTKGNLKEVYREIFRSPELWSVEAYRAKIKKPFHYVASAARALSAELAIDTELPKAASHMGEDLYRCAPPTGYKDVASSWVNPGAMVSRLTFALRLVTGAIRGATVPRPKLEKSPGSAAELLGFFEAQLLPGGLGEKSREVALRELSDEDFIMPDGEVRRRDLIKTAGLILGSPEFQRR